MRPPPFRLPSLTVLYGMQAATYAAVAVLMMAFDHWILALPYFISAVIHGGLSYLHGPTR